MTAVVAVCAYKYIYICISFFLCLFFAELGYDSSSYFCVRWVPLQLAIALICICVPASISHYLYLYLFIAVYNDLYKHTYICISLKKTCFF